MLDSATTRKINLHRGLSLYHLISTQKTEAVEKAQLCLMQQKPVYEL